MGASNDEKNMATLSRAARRNESRVTGSRGVRLAAIVPRTTLVRARLQTKSSCACGASCPKSLPASDVVSQWSDRYERDADYVADEIMHGSSSATGRGALKYGAIVPAHTPPALVPSGGMALPLAARAQFEPHFGDLSAVRVHTGPAATQAANLLNANAFTSGRDVVFGAGQFQTQTRTGQRLLAHELAHVAQQVVARSAAPPVMRDGKGKAPSFPKTGVQVVGSEARDLVAILASCSGMSLDLDKSGALVLKSAGDAKRARSATARAAVKEFFSSKVGVIINADPKAEAVEVGAFGHDYPGLQTLDISNIKTLAAASGEAKGIGECDAVLHEIVEAFAGRELSLKGKVKGEDLYLKAHAKGEKVEKGIRKDLGRPGRAAVEGDTVHFADESKDVMLLLNSTIIGSGKNLYTQISVVRFVKGPIREAGGEKTQSGDYNVVASHVAKGAVRFKNPEEATKVFNKYAADFGFKPIAVPAPKKAP